MKKTYPSIERTKEMLRKYRHLHEQVSITVDEELLEILDKVKGRIPRSSFIEFGIMLALEKTHKALNWGKNCKIKDGYCTKCKKTIVPKRFYTKSLLER